MCKFFERINLLKWQNASSKKYHLQPWAGMFQNCLRMGKAIS